MLYYSNHMKKMLSTVSHMIGVRLFTITNIVVQILVLDINCKSSV